MDVIRHLVYHYGSNCQKILSYAKDHPDMLEMLPESKEVIRAEIVHAVREEMAQKLSDVILRRTDLGSGKHPGRNAMETCVKIMGKELGWSTKRMKTEFDEVDKIYTPSTSGK